MSSESVDQPAVVRKLSLADAVTVGLASMFGAGIFVALPPAAQAAGKLLPLAFVLAASVALCNAMSTAWLAAVHPQSGGAYVYGRTELGPLWGFLAGFAFTVGKTASCAAMALAVGAYGWPDSQRLVASCVVVLVTVVNLMGIEKSTRTMRLLVAVTVVALIAAVTLSFTVSEAVGPQWVAGHGRLGVLEAAGLLFFAFAGYARIATLGGEVRDPERTIPRAVPIALAIALATYLIVALALWWALGLGGVALADDPLAAAVRTSDVPSAVWVVRVGAVAAASGALWSLLLGVSRTVFAMSSDGYGPRQLAVVSAKTQGPARAELLVGFAVLALVWQTDVVGAIGFSSFAVLAYYLVANVSSIERFGRTSSRGKVGVAGAVGCVGLALMLPWDSVLAGALVLAAGAAWFATAEALRERRASPG